MKLKATFAAAIGGGHYSGPGEHPDWQAAMRGLDILCALPGEGGWGPPASLPGAVAELRRLRESWLCGEGEIESLQSLSSWSCWYSAPVRYSLIPQDIF